MGLNSSPGPVDPEKAAALSHKLQGYHVLAATLLQVPQEAQALLLPQPMECDAIAFAVLDVARFYNLEIGDNVIMAWVGLLGTLGSVYGSRAMMLRTMFKASKKPKATAPATPQQAMQDAANKMQFPQEGD